MIRFMERYKIYKANKNLHTIKLEKFPKGIERKNNDKT